MSIYKKNPSGQEEEISSIYRKNPNTGEVTEITSIYKGGKLIYTVNKPLWESGTFNYILEKPQLSSDNTLISHNFNIDKNVPAGLASGINTIYTGQNDKTLGGKSQTFFPSTYNFVGNRYVTKDNKYIYAISFTGSNISLYKMSTVDNSVKNSSLFISNNIFNVYNTGWTQFPTADSPSGFKTVKTPMLLYFVLTTKGNSVARMANLDGFVESGDFPKANGSLRPTLGNPNIIPVDKFKLAIDSSDYGQLSGVHGGIIGIIGKSNIIDDSANSSNYGNAIYLTNGAKTLVSNLDNNTTNAVANIKVTLDVNMGSDSYSGLNPILNPGNDVPIYIDASNLTPLGYYELPGDSSNSIEEHYSFAMPVSLDKNFVEYDKINNNIAIVDIVHYVSNGNSSSSSGADLWAIGVVTSDKSFLKKEFGKVNAIAEDYSNYDKELVVPTDGTSINSQTASFGNTSISSKYYVPKNGSIYASIKDVSTDTNQVKKFRLNGKDSNYWDCTVDGYTGAQVLGEDGDLSADGRFVTSPNIYIPNKSIRVKYVGYGAISGFSNYNVFCFYDKNGNLVNYQKVYGLGLYSVVDIPQGASILRISVMIRGDMPASSIPKTVITFDNNVIYQIPKGYSVKDMVKYKHNLYMTVTNDDSGWGKNLTSPTAGSKILSSGVDNSGNLYSFRTDGSGANNFYYWNTFTSKDGSQMLVASNQHNPGGNNLSLNPWDNQLIWDSFNAKMLFVGNTGPIYSITSPNSSGSLGGVTTASSTNVNYNNYTNGYYPGFCVDNSGSVIMPNSYYNKTGTSTILGTLTKYSVSGTTYTPEWSATPTHLTATQGIIDSKIDKSYIIWDGNAKIAKIDADGNIKFQGNYAFTNDQGNNTMQNRNQPTQFTILPNGNILGVRVNYTGLANGVGSVSQPTTLFVSVIDKDNGNVLSASSIILTGDLSSSVNRVLLANAGYVAVAGTQYSSVRIIVNKEDNSLNLTFWNNTISSGSAGTTSDVRTGIVSLSASDTAIYAGTDSGLVFRYNLEDEFSYKWVSHSMTDVTSNVLVTAQENYIYVTGGNTTSHMSVIKMLPNGNLYESYVKAMKV